MRPWLFALLLTFPCLDAGAATLTGQAAYSDWTKDAPGVRRLITPKDMPPPGATKSSSNGPRSVARPKDGMPNVPAGFSVSEFASNLNEPRQIKVAPNGDIFVAESGGQRIRILRAVADAERAASSEIFIARLRDRPYGMAFYPPGPNPTHLYIATEAQIMRYPYKNGDMKVSGAGEAIVDNLPQGHHWTRDVAFTPGGKTMLVAIGSGSNNGENGMASEERRATILAYDPDGANMRVYASGLRNPVTMAFHPQSGELWTSVNERDGLGDNLPPDYVTRVKEGGFYGWPYYYIGPNEDPDYKDQKPELKKSVLTPDVLIQPHSAPLGLAFYDGAQFPAAYKNSLFVALHGSWNRERRTGYKLVRLPFSGGKATGEYEDFLTGFVTPQGNVWGRPVGVAVAKDGALLMSDDGSGTIWRISYKKEQ